MQKRRLGNSALEVSVVGFGGNNFGGRIDFGASQRVVHRAIELGVTLIDTADSYGNRGGSEECLGRILGEKEKTSCSPPSSGCRWMTQASCTALRAAT